MATPTRSIRPPPASAGVEQRLDLLLGGVGQLPAVGVEELHAVVLRWVVRRGDDDAQVERQQRDGGRGKNACEDGIAAAGHDPASERLLELQARGTRVAPDEDPPAPLQSVAALPSLSTSSVVSSLPTTPRTPSVPKYRLTRGR